jgi:hypothetical protein
MALKTFFAVFAVLAALFGIGFVAAPNDVLAMYGVPASAHVALMARLFGGTLLGLAVIQWLSRDLRDERASSGLLMGLGISHVVNLLISISATLAGTINALGWTTVLIYLCGAVGCGYFLKERGSALANRGG